jgi:hypothetical protein
MWISNNITHSPSKLRQNIQKKGFRTFLSSDSAVMLKISPNLQTLDANLEVP